MRFARCLRRLLFFTMRQRHVGYSSDIVDGRHAATRDAAYTLHICRDSFSRDTPLMMMSMSDMLRCCRCQRAALYDYDTPAVP